MKTAISVDDDLLNEADRAAREMGLSRSRLVSNALEAYLRARKRERMIAQLNQSYGGQREPSGARLLRGMKARFRSVVKDRW